MLHAFPCLLPIRIKQYFSLLLWRLHQSFQLPWILLKGKCKHPYLKTEMTKWFCSSFRHIEVKQCIFVLLHRLRQPLQLPQLPLKGIMDIHIKHVDDKIVLFRVFPPSEVKQNIFLLVPRLRQPLLPIVGVRRHHVSSPEPPKLSYLLPCPFPLRWLFICTEWLNCRSIMHLHLKSRSLKNPFGCVPCNRLTED